MRYWFLVALVIWPGVAAARECAYYGVMGPSVYNGENGLTEDYANAIDAAGLGAVRINFRIDTQTTWSAALYDRYDALVDRARQHGTSVLGIVLYESTPLGQAAWNDDADGDGVNAYVTTFVDIATALMSRYGDTIKHWEIWNEPNCWSNADYRANPQAAGCYYILPRVYAKLLTETFVRGQPVITQKGLSLVTGGLLAHDIGGSVSTATDYMREVYEQGPWDWLQANHGRRYPWDEFGYHIYVDQGSATTAATLAQYLDAVRALQAEFSDGAPVWLTEFGWSTQNVSEAVQAANLDVALSLFESRADIARTFVFKLDDYDGWGLYRADGSAKPARMTVLAHTAGCTRQPRLVDGGLGDGALASGDAALADAQVSVDAARGAGEGGGCGCRAGLASTNSPSPVAWLLLALILATARRTRRRP